MINEWSKTKSPKTVSNYHGFISAILGTFRPDMKIHTKLPQKVQNETYTLSQEDVRALLEAGKGSKFEIAITLACYGMRRSEICALTLDDIEGDVIHINKAMVQNENKEWVVKSTKTTDSTRDIIISKDLANRIKEQGIIYAGHPNSISIYLNKVEKRLGIQRFSIHKLRHYFASQMSSFGVPDADIMKLGGWQSDHVMKSIYRHSMMEKE